MTYARAAVLWFLLAWFPAGADRLDFPLVNRDIVLARLGRHAQKNQDRYLRLRELFEEAGCTGDRLQDQRVKGERQPNVVCTLAGKSASRIIVGAHFDRLGQGDGVIDNWSGASLLASFFEGMNAREWRHTFTFVGFTAEETGLVGARHFVKVLTPEERQNIRAMVNLDSIGMATTNVWQSKSSPALLTLFEQLAAALKAEFRYVNADRVGDGDVSAFRDKGIPTIDFHSVLQENLHWLHSRDDKIGKIIPDEYYKTYRLVAAYLAWLDQRLE